MKSTYYFISEDITLCTIQLLGPPVDGRGLITHIWTRDGFRKKSFATKLMRQIVRDADAEGIELWLSVQPEEYVDFDWLSEWYDTFGFHEVLSGDPTRVRYPVTTVNL